MDIVYTFDDGYSIVTAVSLLSLLENNKDESIINIYIIDCGISKENIKKFVKLGEKYKRKIYFINGKNMEYKIPISLELSYWSFVCYVRLFFCELLPYVDKVIHIDCDTLILKNIREVYNTDLKDNLCAGCYDCLPTPKYMAGFDKETAYISNGFLIFDLKKMREEKIQEKFVDYIVKKKGILPHLDQDVVNAVLRNRIKILPAKYNLMTYTITFKEKSLEFFDDNDVYYNKQQIHDALINPSIIHFVGFRFVSKPWLQPCYHEYNKEWIKYYNEINIVFDDDRNIIKAKKKKYGIIREIICLFWNIAWKISFMREIEFKIEKRRIKKKYLININKDANMSKEQHLDF